MIYMKLGTYLQDKSKGRFDAIYDKIAFQLLSKCLVAAQAIRFSVTVAWLCH